MEQELVDKRLYDFARSASDWFWETETNHRFRWFSDSYTLLGGSGRSHTIGRTRWDLTNEAVGNEKWQRHREDMDAHRQFRDFRYSMIGKDGLEVWRSASGVPFFDDDGAFAGYRGTAHDITKMVQTQLALEKSYAELETLNVTLEARVEERAGELNQANKDLSKALEELRASRERAIQNEKLAALGTLMAGVAHEINNPLMGISNYIDYVIRRTDNERFSEVLGKAVTCVDLISEIVKNMLSYVRPNSSDIGPISPTRSMMEAGSLLAIDFGNEGISLDINLPDDLPMVLANPSVLQQITMNLLLNARDAVSESEVKAVSVDAWTDSESVHVAFQDSGPGVPKNIETQIFDPFFTTKPPGQGTGLGLSVTSEVVESLDGKLTLLKAGYNDAPLNLVDGALHDQKGKVQAPYLGGAVFLVSFKKAP